MQWSLLVLALCWYGLAVCTQLLAAQLDLDYFLIPWCVLASSTLVYGLAWLHPLLPRGWKASPASPVPRLKNRTVAGQQQQQQQAQCSSDSVEGGASESQAQSEAALSDSAEVEDSGVAETVALLSSHSASASSTAADVACPTAAACSPQPQDAQWLLSHVAGLSALLGLASDAGSADNALLAVAAVCNVFYHTSSLYAGLWIGDSSLVLIWRSLEPLLLHVIHSRRVALSDALQGAMLLFLLLRWDKPAQSDLSTWLMQRSLIVAGSVALCCCNQLLHTRCQSGDVGRSFFSRVAGYSLLLSMALWAVFLPIVPVQSLLRAVGFAFPLLSLCTALYIFVGWLLLTHCTLELYSLLLMAKRGVVVNGVYLMYLWRQVQALLILASVTLSSLIECSKNGSQRRWSILPLLLVCATAVVQRAVELPHAYAVLPLVPLSVPARHIAVISAAGNGNLGDNVQVDAWRFHLDRWTERTGVPVVLHSWSRELCCTDYDDTLKKYMPSDPISITRLLKETPPLDWIWIGGGGLLSCPHPPLNDNDPAWQHHLLQRAELSHTKVAFMALGARERELVDLVHPLLEAAAYIGLRDTLSVEVVADTKLNRSRIAVMHDAVLAMQPLVQPLSREAVRVPTCWILQGPWKANPTINQLVDSFFQPGDDLLLTMEAKDGSFGGRFNPDFVRLHDRDLTAFEASLQHCDFVISMRFHGVVIAAALGIPALGMDMTRSMNSTGKTTALFSSTELDRPDCVLYPAAAHSNLTYAEVKALHNQCRRHTGAREHLQKRMAAIRAEFQTEFDLVMAM